MGESVFYVHSEVIKQHSEPLSSMIEKDFQEKRQGWAALKEYEAATFDRFLEWAYKGFYTAADYAIVEAAADSESEKEQEEDGVTESKAFNDVVEIVEDEPPPQSELSCGVGYRSIEPNSDWSNFSISTKRYKEKKDSQKKKGISSPAPPPSAQENLKKEFQDRKPAIRKEIIRIPSARPNSDSSEGYEAVFLCHAQLYVFAEEFLIEDLRLLALDELHASLAKFTLYRERTGDIVSLLRYAYAKTSYRIDQEGLLSLLADYIAIEMDTLVKDVEFGNLLVENANRHGGALLADFLNMVSKRL